MYTADFFYLRKENTEKKKKEQLGEYRIFYILKRRKEWRIFKMTKTKKGIELKLAYTREGFTQREIARAVGVSPSLISKTLTGERHIKSEKKRKIIARILNRPEEVLFD